MACIHEILDEIIFKNNLYVFAEIFNKNKNLYYYNCSCRYKFKEDLYSCAVQRAIIHRAFDILKYILQNTPKGKVIDKNVYANITVLSNKEIAELLLARGLNPNAKDEYFHNQLEPAVLANNKELVELLLRNGADPNIKSGLSSVPLHFVRDHTIAKLLLDFGADPNKKNRFGSTPLHDVMDKGYEKIIKVLLDGGACPDLQDEDGDTPLHSAVKNSNVKNVELLLSHGADPNIKNRMDDTPLHYVAVKNKKLRIVELLLSYGADPNLKNCDKKTPLQLSAHGINVGIFDLLYKKTSREYVDSDVATYAHKHMIQKIHEINLHFILQSYEFDENSLFSKYYIGKDMLFLIINEAKNQQLLQRYEKFL